MSKKKGLGRGLEHLIAQNVDLTNEDSKNEVVEISLNDIKPNPFQPRKTFNEEALNELATSIKAQGVFQPILVRKSVIGFEIISGERRYRAAKLAGLETIPAITYNYNDNQMMEVALIENIQREDLTVIEEAKSYQMMIDKLAMTQAELAKKVGKSRSHITNTLSLLKLSETVINQIDEQKITMGHAKVLVSLGDEAEVNTIVDEIINNKLSVRETEKVVKNLKDEKLPNLKTKTAKKRVKENNNSKIEQLMEEKLKTKVRVNGSDKGTIEINFKSEEDLERLLELLKIV